MATPKTDIEQSVGRILREKHSQPVVVDIIDSHDPFQKQWYKRKAFYKKENYKIIYTKSANYDANTSGWRTIFEPNKKCVDDDDTGEKDSLLTGKCLVKLLRKV
jgi:hypothetical protein